MIAAAGKKVKKDDPAFVVRRQPYAGVGAGRPVLMHLPRTGASAFPPGCPESGAELAGARWALWVDERGEAHTAVIVEGQHWKPGLAYVERTFSSFLDGTSPLPGAEGGAPVRALFLAARPQMAPDAVGASRVQVVRSRPGEPGLDDPEVVAVARDDVLGRLGRGQAAPPWTTEAFAVGVAAMLLVVLLAGVPALLLPGDGSARAVIFVAAAVLGLLAADRARREVPSPRAVTLAAALLPTRFLPGLLALYRSRNGTVVSPATQATGGRVMVAHSTWPERASMPHTEDDAWALWLEPDGTWHSVAPPVRWWRRGPVPAVQPSLVFAPGAAAGTIDGAVRAIGVRRAQPSGPLTSPLYVYAQPGGPGVTAAEACEVARFDVSTRTGARADASGQRTLLDLFRGGATSLLFVYLPWMLVSSVLFDTGPSGAIVFVAAGFGFATAWRSDRVLVREAGAIVLPERATEAQVQAAVEQVRAR